MTNWETVRFCLDYRTEECSVFIIDLAVWPALNTAQCRHTVRHSNVFAINLALRALLCGVQYKQWAALPLILPALSPAETVRWQISRGGRGADQRGWSLSLAQPSQQSKWQSSPQNPNLIPVYTQIIPAEPRQIIHLAPWPRETRRKLRNEPAATAAAQEPGLCGRARNQRFDDLLVWLTDPKAYEIRNYHQIKRKKKLLTCHRFGAQAIIPLHTGY